MYKEMRLIAENMLTIFFDNNVSRLYELSVRGFLGKSEEG